MNRLQGSVVSVLAVVALLLSPLVTPAYAADKSPKAPPIGQPLVREGDFAVDLVPALKLGGQVNEANAEDMLTKAGIEPKNGWIADYPVTPDIVGELHATVGQAADSGKLAMSRKDADEAFGKVLNQEGLFVSNSSGGRSADMGYASGSSSSSSSSSSAESGSSSSSSYSAQSSSSETVYYTPAEIQSYYDENGPPVVTYYPPPYDYTYLYSWVPYPFWWWDVGYWGLGWPWFGGFFVLNDFNGPFFAFDHFHHFHHGWNHGWNHNQFATVSNHVRDPATGRTARVDPVNRSTTRALASVNGSRGFATTAGRTGASTILNHSVARSNVAGNGGTTAGAARLAAGGTTARNGTAGGIRSGGDGSAFGHTRTSVGPSTSTSGRSFSSAPRSSFSSGSFSSAPRSSFSGGGFSGRSFSSAPHSSFSSGGFGNGFAGSGHSFGGGGFGGGHSFGGGGFGGGGHGGSFAGGGHGGGHR